MKEVLGKMKDMLSKKKWINIDVYESGGYSYLVQVCGSNIRNKRIGFTNDHSTTARLRDKLATTKNQIK